MIANAYVVPLSSLLWIISTVAAYPEASSPLYCRYLKADSLIRCAVVAEEIAVTDAAINEGKCRSPLEVFEINKLMMKRNFGVDMEQVGSFVRTYKKGDEFSLNVDKGCAVYMFSVRSKDNAFHFRVTE